MKAETLDIIYKIIGWVILLGALGLIIKNIITKEYIKAVAFLLIVLFMLFGRTTLQKITDFLEKLKRK